jgi:hypothetical protein
MPQIDWTPEHKRTSSLEFDRLKLKVNERARIVLLEKPSFTWVHTLRAPKISEGRASKVIKKRKDGSEFADWDMDFIGRPQCIGDPSAIDADGLDPQRCPVCARAKDSEETAAPERRFAINVIKYNTRADGQVVTPFGCASQVWTFTENIFNKLYEIAQEYGGLVGRDLLLGPCQVPEAFQKFDITAGAKNLWESSEDIKKIVVETHQQNRIEDLDAACGRRVEARWLKDDVEKIAKRWRIAHGVSSDTDKVSEKADMSSLKSELDNLLAAAPATPEPVPVQADEKPRESGGGEDPADFSKLLQDLKL